MRNLFLIILITLGSVLVNAQNLVLPLYGKAEFEKIASLMMKCLNWHVYLTDKPSSQAVVVCPGGGYKGLSFGSGGSLCGKMAKSERHCSPLSSNTGCQREGKRCLSKI
ncbi:MAG: hypothetical protein ACLUE2_17420 [Bacteroides cellulosilyticus]